MKIVTILPKRCIACGLCQVCAPKIFDYHDSGIVKFIATSKEQLAVQKESLSSVVIAAHKCPVQAIILKD
ncbi:MAG: ferredoxin [Streptococcaceae bacterium]|jgi:ferredoxin|nr:ferredoxin [Streptococcaceae bacterium]